MEFRQKRQRALRALTEAKSRSVDTSRPPTLHFTLHQTSTKALTKVMNVNVNVTKVELTGTSYVQNRKRKTTNERGTRLG